MLDVDHQITFVGAWGQGMKARDDLMTARAKGAARRQAGIDMGRGETFNHAAKRRHAQHLRKAGPMREGQNLGRFDRDQRVFEGQSHPVHNVEPIILEAGINLGPVQGLAAIVRRACPFEPKAARRGALLAFQRTKQRLAQHSGSDGAQVQCAAGHGRSEQGRAKACGLDGLQNTPGQNAKRLKDRHGEGRKIGENRGSGQTQGFKLGHFAHLFEPMGDVARKDIAKDHNGLRADRCIKGLQIGRTCWRLRPALNDEIQGFNVQNALGGHDQILGQAKPLPLCEDIGQKKTSGISATRMGALKPLGGEAATKDRSIVEMTERQVSAARSMPE